MKRLLAALAFLSLPALAHGPWPLECCHNRDCAEVDARHIREDGERIHITIPPGAHPMVQKETFRAIAPRHLTRKPVTGEWGVCISPSGALLCVFRPNSGV